MMPRIDTNGIQTYYDEQGVGVDTLVLVHGGDVNHHLWDEVMPPFSARYRVVRHDLRGCGASEAPATDYSYDDYAADLLALLDELGIERCHLLGLCEGGGIAIHTALAHPERLQSLILVGALIPGQDWAAPSAVATAPRRRHLEAEGQEAVMDYLLDHSPIMATIRARPELYQRMRAMLATASPAPMLDPNLVTYPRPNDYRRLGEIRLPTLILVGDRDLAPIQRNATQLAMAVPGARLATIPRAGHYPPFEEPVAFSQCVLDFLAQLPAG
jgi:3-oxoadipate enol-lactonase